MRWCPLGRAATLALLVLGATSCRNVAYEHTASSLVRAGLELSDPSLDPFRVGPAVMTILVLQDTWGEHDIVLYLNGADSSTAQQIGIERVIARNSAGSYGIPVVDFEPRELEVTPDTWALNAAHLAGALQDSIVGAEGDLEIEVVAMFEGESTTVSFELPRRVSWWVVPP